MAFINAGARVDGKRCRTKAALKRALKDAPESVRFDCTELLTSNAGRSIKGTEVPEGDTLIVAGPDPYNARNWFANVKIGRNGVTVS